MERDRRPMKRSHKGTRKRRRQCLRPPLASFLLAGLLFSCDADYKSYSTVMRGFRAIEEKRGDEMCEEAKKKERARFL